MAKEMQEKLYRQYNLEQKRYKLFVRILRSLAYSMLFLYLYLLFSKKGLDPKYFLLNIYALYCNASVMVLFQLYKVPTLFQNLISNDEMLISESYRIIDNNRSEIYISFLKELYGRNYTEEQANFSLKEIQSLIHSLKRSNWKLIGRIYFVFFCLVSLFLFNLLYPLEVN